MLSKLKKSDKPIEKVVLRDYSRAIFFYPLFFASFVFFLIQVFLPQPSRWLGFIWMTIFFCNLFVVAFDFSTTKFFILMLVIALLIFFLIFFVPHTLLLRLKDIEANLEISWKFYITFAIVLGIILLFVLIESSFDYWIVEKNEIHHKMGIFQASKRYPTKSLRYTKLIPDVFKWIALRSGTFVMEFGHKDETFTLNVVPNLNKKAEQLDILLSEVAIESSESNIVS